MAIPSFRGEYQFLSNFYRCDVVYKGIKYTSVESAYQASKFENERTRELMSNMTASEAKKFSKGHHPSQEWYNSNIRIMVDLLAQKFTQQYFKERLLATKGEDLIEGNSWHDNFWGDCVCDRCKSIEGKNILGFLLMGIRDCVLPEFENNIAINDMESK